MTMDQVMTPKRAVIEGLPRLGYACSEAINTLCTNLSFSGENVRKIMITSCHAAEGKTFLSVAMMQRMAQYKKTVALVDADLRMSNLASRYGIHFSPEGVQRGLSHYLAGMADVEDVIYDTNVEGACLAPIGRAVTNPLPLLNSPRLGALLDALAQRVDYVLVDAPPMGVVIDGAQIAKSCDGALIVVNYNSVHRQELIDLQRQLEQTNCPILGTVLNMVEYDTYLSKKYYYKSYYDHYGDDRQANRRREKKRKHSQKK